MSGAYLPPTAGTLKNPVPLLEKRIELLEKEVELLTKKLRDAYGKLAKVGGESVQQAFEALLEELREAEEAHRSEEEAKTGPAEDNGKVDSDKPSVRRPRTKGHGPTEQPDLRRVDDIHELSQEQRTCPSCEGELVPLGDQFEEYEEIHTIQREYVLRTVKLRKYRCRCNGAVVTAPGPKRLVSGGRYSTDFTVDVAVNKYDDHIPLERQVRMMARYGLVTTSQALCDQLAALMKLMLPNYEALGRRLLEAPLIHADETRWPMLDQARASPWCVWTRCTPDIAHYSLLKSKSAEAGRSLFCGYSGFVVVDGYAVYAKLAKENTGLRLVNCWAHALRKFRDIREKSKKPCDHVLSLIGKLYDVEDEVPGDFPGDECAQALRRRLREEKSKPILDEIHHWATTEVGLPRSDLGKAVFYLLKRWDGFTRFLEDPRIPLDNNAAERSLRGVVIGRKVHYGSKSRQGTEVAAVLYTLVETAKLCGVEPAHYLRTAVQRALEKPGTVFLPHDLLNESADADQPLA